MTDHELSCYIVGRQNHLAETGRHNRVYKLAEYGSQEYSKLLLGYAIHDFAAEMYDKALKAREKYGFNPLGWASPDWEAELQRGIAEHLQKGDPRDVAVYALFAYFHGWSTATPPAPATGLLEPLRELARENALAIVHEVLNDWLNENEASDFDENDVASLFGMLGTAGYSIVPNAALPRPTAPAATAGAWVAVSERLPERLIQGEAAMWYSEYVLLHLGFHKLPVVGYYDYGKGYECFQCTDRDEEFPTPTHWQPLPAPPTDAH